LVAKPSRIFTIKNTGSGPLTALSITIDGTDAAMFSVVSGPTAPVSPGGSTTFTLQFAPGSAGSKSAALHMANNDSNENPFDILLSGTGTLTLTGSLDADFDPRIAGNVAATA